MGHPAEIKILLAHEKTYPWPVGVKCDRDRLLCESYLHEKQCHGKTCPYHNGCEKREEG